jgi:hypothetical protein
MCTVGRIAILQPMLLGRSIGLLRQGRSLGSQSIPECNEACTTLSLGRLGAGALFLPARAPGARGVLPGFQAHRCRLTGAGSCDGLGGWSARGVPLVLLFHVPLLDIIAVAHTSNNEIVRRGVPAVAVLRQIPRDWRNRNQTGTLFACRRPPALARSGGAHRKNPKSQAATAGAQAWDRRVMARPIHPIVRTASVTRSVLSVHVYCRTRAALGRSDSVAGS